MKKRIIGGIFILGLSLFLSVADVFGEQDKVNYNFPSFTKTRQVGDWDGYITFATSTTNTNIKLPRTTVAIKVKNTDSTDAVYVNFHGATAYNLDGNDMTTQVGSNKATSGATNFATEGVQVNDVLILDEGDNNDGVYYIVAINGKELTLDRVLSVAHVGNQDFVLSSTYVGISSTDDNAISYEYGTNEIGIVAAANTPTVRIWFLFQKGN